MKSFEAYYKNLELKIVFIMEHLINFVKELLMKMEM